MRKAASSAAALRASTFVAAASLAALAGTGAVRAQSPSPSQCPVPTPTGSVAPFAPDDSVKKILDDTLKSAPVVAMRATFDDAGGGKTLTPSAARALKNVDPGLLRDRFAVMDDERSVMGGQSFIVFFPKHPATLYSVWVDELGSSGPWEVRAFQPLGCTSAQMRFVIDRYGANLETLPAS